MSTRSNRWTRAALALGSLMALAGCTKKQTSIVLWLNTDIPLAAFDHLTVTANGTGPNGMVMTLPATEYRPTGTGGQFPLPGSIVLDRVGAETLLDVTVDVTLRDGNGTPFQVKARGRYTPDQWRQLTVFLPYQCSDEAIRAQCARRSMETGNEFTCGAAGADPCILVERQELQAFDMDASTPPLPDAATPSMDAAMESGPDASLPDSAPDSAPDATPDVVQMNGPAHAALLQVAPRAGAYFSGFRPSLTVKLPATCDGATGIEVVLCPGLSGASESCAGRVSFVAPISTCNGNVQKIVTATLPAGSVPSAAGYWSWGARLITDTPALLRRGPLAFRPMELRANSSATGLTSLLGVVPDLDGDGRGDILAGNVGYTPTGSPPPKFALHSTYTSMMPGLSVFAPSLPSDASISGNFGATMLLLGDAELDGSTDVLFADSATASMDSKAYRYTFTAAGAGTFAPHPTQAQFGVSATATPVTGYGNAGVSADFNGDGYVDVLLGSGSYSATDVPMVFYGSATGYATTGTRAVALSTPMPLENFGWVIAGNCDINGDGYPDAIISSHNGVGDGKVSFFYGSASGLGPSARFELSESDLTPLTGFGVGIGLACNGDVDRDGIADIAIGAQSGETNLPGGVVVLAGDATRSPLARVLWQRRGMFDNSGFGGTLEFVGDIVQGTPTLAIGEPNRDMAAGRVTLVGYRSAVDLPTQDMGSTRMPASLGSYGYEIRFLGPVGTMNRHGFVVGEPFSGTDQSGRVEIYTSNASNAIPLVAIEPGSFGAIMSTTYGGRFAR